jgi:hypothetical protein
MHDPARKQMLSCDKKSNEQVPGEWLILFLGIGNSHRDLWAEEALKLFYG